jgi:hypothetical protein
MRDPRYATSVSAGAALAARHSAFHHQTQFPPIPLTRDQSGLYSDYSPPRGHLQEWEMAE